MTTATDVKGIARKILILVPHLGRGGIERNAETFALWFKRAGREVAVYAFEKGGARAETLLAAGIPVWVGPDMAAQALAWDPDVVNVRTHGFRSEPIRNFLVQLRGASAAGIVESNSFARPNPSLPAGLVDLHVLISRWCLWEWASVTAHLRPRPLGLYLPNIQDEERFYPESEVHAAEFRNGLELGQDVILCSWLGRPYVDRWSPVAIRAWSIAAKQFPNLHLLLVGLSPDLEVEVERLPMELKSRIHRLSAINSDSELRKFYTATDIFLHSTRIGESFGNVISEAQLCGTPVVTLSTPHRTNAQLEVTGHGEGGYVASSLEGYTRAVVRLATDPALRTQLGKTGMQRVKQLYSPRVCVPRMLEVLDLVVRFRRSHRRLHEQLGSAGFMTMFRGREINVLAKNSEDGASRALSALFYLRSSISRCLVPVPYVYPRWHHRGWEWLAGSFTTETIR